MRNRKIKADFIENSKKIYDEYDSEDNLDNYLCLEYQSELKKSDVLYSVNREASLLINELGICLKGKKHEWIVFVFIKGTIAQRIWVNKGMSADSVGSRFKSEFFLSFAKKNEYDQVFQ